MTHEEQQLLFKDLCARLPYGIYCQTRYKHKNKVLEECKQLDGTFFNSIECLFRSESGAEYSTDYKPYLRPMSSMTKKEKNRYDILVEETIYRPGVLTCSSLINFCHEHHLDNLGLIEKGLALEAPEGMYES